MNEAAVLSERMYKAWYTEAGTEIHTCHVVIYIGNDMIR